MSAYSTNEVAELVGMTADSVRAFAKAGLLSAADGHLVHQRYRYTFQDVVLLRMAKELQDARIRPTSVSRALRTLKKRLPRGRPLSSVRVLVQGGEVLIQDQQALWHPESGQMQIDFSISNLARNIEPLIREAVQKARKRSEGSADDWYNLGIDLEMIEDYQQAHAAYQRAVDLEPGHADAYTNLGRLEHMAGDDRAALERYRAALEISPDHVTAWFNLGVALETLDIQQEALNAYLRVLALEHDFPDAHFNLAHLYEEIGNVKAAVRHLSIYRKQIRALHAED